MLFNLNDLVIDDFFNSPFFFVCLAAIVILVIMLVVSHIVITKERAKDKEETLVTKSEVTVVENTKEDAIKSQQEEDILVETNETIESEDLAENNLVEETLTEEVHEVETKINPVDVEENQAEVSIDDVEEFEAPLENVSETQEEIVEDNKETKEEVLQETLVEDVVEEETELNIQQNEVIDSNPEDILAKDLVKEVAPSTFIVRYKKSLQAKLILDPELQDPYKEIKDYFLSFKKVKSRVSFKKERFSLGREVLVNLTIRGKKIYIYYALDPNFLDEKYHLTDVSDKAIGEKTPALLKVKSKRSIKYAKDLFDILVAKNSIIRIPENKLEPTDYNDFLKERSFEQLLLEGLIVQYQTKGSRPSVDDDEDDENDSLQSIAKDLQNTIDSAQKVLDKILESKELKENSPQEVTAEVAEALVSDEVVENEVIYNKTNATGKLVIINIDTISNMFKDGDLVNIDTLKKKKLLPPSAKRVKVLARGTINKTLEVHANEFSKQAMKMILSKGGKVVVC